MPHMAHVTGWWTQMSCWSKGLLGEKTVRRNFNTMRHEGEPLMREGDFHILRSWSRPVRLITSFTHLFIHSHAQKLETKVYGDPGHAPKITANKTGCMLAEGCRPAQDLVLFFKWPVLGEAYAFTIIPTKQQLHTSCFTNWLTLIGRHVSSQPLD